MEEFDDFKELFECLNNGNVEYVVVGGYAVAFHGVPRSTNDIDVYVQPVEGNATRLMGALKEFGFGSLDLSKDDFSAPGKVVQLGVPPVRIDLLTSIDGVEWDEVWEGRVQAKYAGVPIDYIGLSELVRNKRSTTRLKDKADIEAFEAKGICDEESGA